MIVRFYAFLLGVACNGVLCVLSVVFCTAALFAVVKCHVNIFLCTKKSFNNEKSYL